MSADGTNPYGFTWGPAEVTRMAEIKGLRILRVATDQRDLQISVSLTGRSVRVWRDGKELK